jgi:hypothetical protein
MKLRPAMGNPETQDDELDRLLLLEPGWDSYAADPVSHESVAQARQCLYETWRYLGRDSEPVIGPTPSGGVVLSWRRPGRGELDALFAASGGTYVIIGPDGQVTQKGTITNCSIFVVEVLKRWL